jgi:hypothetical protein
MKVRLWIILNYKRKLSCIQLSISYIQYFFFLSFIGVTSCVWTMIMVSYRPADMFSLVREFVGFTRDSTSAWSSYGLRIMTMAPFTLYLVRTFICLGRYLFGFSRLARFAWSHDHFCCKYCLPTKQGVAFIHYWKNIA